MTPHESHLLSDGSVFPPVTPDPPLPPGQVEVEVPDIVPVASPDGPDTERSTRDNDATTEVAGVRPDAEPTD